MRRTRRALIVLLVILLLAVLVIPAGGYLFLRRSLPQTSGSLSISGLQSKVEIVRDASGIPYIYAASDRDAFMALGYLHAQDRLWQLEIQRRTGAGRLAEILGEPALKTDQFLRTLGVYRAAESALPAIGQSARDALEAYAAGINAYLDSNPTLPPEFLILGVKPERWAPIDSLVWAKMMAWDLGGNYTLELLYSQILSVAGPDRLAQLAPGYPDTNPTILASLPALAPAPVTADLLALNESLQLQLGLGGEHVGSNNWVVAGSRTASGKPLLADDPHLGTRIPSIWYLAGIHGDTIHAAGATFPGLPAVVIGHNERVAWGVTNLGPDVQDLYVEKIHPQDFGLYEVNGQWVPVEIHPETILVKGEKEPVQWAARSTRHGPLISDVSDQRGSGLAFRWTALDPGDTTLDAFLGLNYARNWDEFREALRSLVAPSQNFVYADVDGNTGYYGPGHIPIRSQGQGNLPVPGWNDDYRWTGWIPFDELPHAYNPADGYVVTANNRVVPPSYPHFITNDWDSGYRARRIVELLTASGDLTVDDFARIQADQTPAQAAELLPFLLQAQVKEPLAVRALDLLRGWDGAVAAGSVPAAIYETWYVHLYRQLIGDKFGGDLGTRLLSRHNPLFLASVLSGRQPWWCDDVLTPDKESCAAATGEALESAVKDLEKRLGNDVSRWKWGELHKTQFPHTPFSEVGLLKPLFHRSIANGGDTFTVNVSPYRLNAKEFDSPTAPSFARSSTWRTGTIRASCTPPANRATC